MRRVVAENGLRGLFAGSVLVTWCRGGVVLQVILHVPRDTWPAVHFHEEKCYLVQVLNASPLEAHSLVTLTHY